MDQPKYRIEIFWSDEDGGYIANVPDLRYCSAFGESYEEALREVLVAMELHLDTLKELGGPIPEPVSRRGVGGFADVHDPGDAVQIVEEVDASAVEAVDRAFETQRSGIRLSRRFFENWVETLEDRAERNRHAMQRLNELVEEQKQVLREALPESINATEAAKRKAEELGVDLSRIEGTGSGGLIIVKDVVKAAHR